LTIINAFIAHDHALVGVDSECRGDDGKIHPVAKMLPIVHMNAVLAVAGNLLYANKLMSTIHLLSADFDELLADMPKLLRAALAMTKTQGDLSGVKFQKDPAGETVVVAGFSPKAGRVIGRYWHDFREREINPCIVHPSFDNLDPALFARLDALPRPDSMQAMARMAQEQAAIYRENRERMPRFHAGGQFIIAGITPGGLAITPVCEL
jgi:hypothetical protein